MDLLDKIEHGGLTHNGTFHADDVLSTCLLKLLNKNFKYIRKCDVPENFEGVVYDIGGGKYDHHDKVKKRANGKNYAAFGLLWRDLGSYFMDQEHEALFDDVFVSEIDKCDTTNNTNVLSSSIECFNPRWNAKIDSDKAFQDAVDTFTPLLGALLSHFKKSTFVPRYCRTIQEDFVIAINNLLKGHHRIPNTLRYDNAIETWKSVCQEFLVSDYEDLFIHTFLSQVQKTYGKYKTSPFILGISLMPRRARIDLLQKIMLERIEGIKAMAPAAAECKRVYESAKDKSALVFNTYVPNLYLAENCNDVEVVIFPSERGGYNLLSVEHKQGTNPVKRFYFPAELRGKDKEYLQGSHNGLLFVHQAGFMATCASLDSAKAFYDKVHKHL